MDHFYTLAIPSKPLNKFMEWHAIIRIKQYIMASSVESGSPRDKASAT